MQQQVTEIARVQREQSRLILRVQLGPPTICEPLTFTRVDVLRHQPLVLPLVDQPAKRARGEPLLVDIGGDDELLHHAQLIVGVEDREVGLQPDQFGMAAQHLRADCVEGAEPRHAFNVVADNPPHPLTHFARRLVREGDAQDFGRIGFACVEEVCEPRRQCRGLPSARTRQHEHRPIGGQHRLTLRRVQSAQVGRFVDNRMGGSHP